MGSKVSTTKVTAIWIALLLLSAISAYVGEFGQTNTIIIGFVIVALIAKGQLIVDHFMDLAHVKTVWRLALSGFCIVLGAIMFTTYYLSLPSPAF